jgi:uncharacterized small protein (DUF1192 family)
MACASLTFLKNAFSVLQMWVEELWQDTVNLRLATADLRKDLTLMQAELGRLRAQLQRREETEERRLLALCPPGPAPAQPAGLLALCHPVRAPRLAQFEKLAPSCQKAAWDVQRLEETFGVAVNI